MNLKSRITSKVNKAIFFTRGLLRYPDRPALEKKITDQIRRSLGGRPISVSTGNRKLSVKVTSGGDVRLGL